MFILCHLLVTLLCFTISIITFLPTKTQSYTPIFQVCLKKKMGTPDSLGLHPGPLDLADILPGLLGVGRDQQRWGQLHLSCPQVSGGATVVVMMDHH